MFQQLKWKNHENYYIMQHEIITVVCNKDKRGQTQLDSHCHIICIYKIMKQIKTNL